MIDECEISNPKRSGPKPKRLFVVEHRWLPEYFERSPWLKRFSNNNEWRVWKRYETEKSRASAMASLPRTHGKHYEFRVQE